jgi:tetratricopeptide (TPR) repeat protein
MGALSLTRENALVLVLVVAAWAVRGEGPGVGNRESGVGRRKRLIAFAAGLALVLLPVAARNYAVGGGFYLTTSQFGPNFYIGNHAGSDGTYVSLRPGRGAPEFERQDATELAERAEGRPLTPAEVSGYWTDRAMAFIASDPGAWLRLLARKAALLVNTSEMLDTESQESYAEVSWPLRVLGGAGHFGVLVPLAALGVWTLWPDRRRLWVFFLLPAAYAASVVVFYVFARYRVALVPFLVLFASAGLAGARAWTGRASRRELVVAGVALAALAAFVNRPLLSSARMRAITETNLGASLQEAGRLDAAVARYERAIAIQPDYAPAYNNLGLALAAQGRLEEAASRFQSAVSAAPSQASAHRHLGSVQATLGRTADALASLARAVALDPRDVGARYDFGSLLLEQQRFAEAADQFRAALDVTPDHVRALNNLGIALASQGRLDEALAAFERAVQLQPDFADALKNLEMARRALRRR